LKIDEKNAHRKERGVVYAKLFEAFYTNDRKQKEVIDIDKVASGSDGNQ
jgi:hypothetical protein